MMQQCQLTINNIITLELPDQNNWNQVFLFFQWNTIREEHKLHSLSFTEKQF